MTRPQTPRGFDNYVANPATGGLGKGCPVLLPRLRVAGSFMPKVSRARRLNHKKIYILPFLQKRELLATMRWMPHPHAPHLSVAKGCLYNSHEILSSFAEHQLSPRGREEIFCNWILSNPVGGKLVVRMSGWAPKASQKLALNLYNEAVTAEDITQC